MFRTLAASLMICGALAVAPATSLPLQGLSSLSLEGTVMVELEEDYFRPVEGAVVEIHRLDVGGHWSAKTDRSGRYVILGMPSLGTYLILVSGPGIQPIWANRHPLKQATRIDFISLPGDGARLTRDQAQALIAGGRSRPLEVRSDREQQLKVKLAYSKDELRRAFKDLEEYEKEVKRALALQARFDRARDYYNEGVELINLHRYETALERFETAAAVDTSAHPAFAELAR